MCVVTKTCMTDGVVILCFEDTYNLLVLTVNVINLACFTLCHTCVYIKYTKICRLGENHFDSECHLWVMENSLSNLPLRKGK